MGVRRQGGVWREQAILAVIHARQWEGERRLVAAALERVLRDIKIRQQRPRLEAWVEWDQEPEWCFSLDGMCGVLGLDAARVRVYLRKRLREQAGADGEQ